MSVYSGAGWHFEQLILSLKNTFISFAKRRPPAVEKAAGPELLSEMEALVIDKKPISDAGTAFLSNLAERHDEPLYDKMLTLNAKVKNYSDVYDTAQEYVESK